jgi:hypothetical protein
MTTKPLHVAIVTGKQLRFFRSPNNDGRPDFPWHSTNDLQSVFGGPGLHARRGGRGMLARSRQTVESDARSQPSGNRVKRAAKGMGENKAAPTSARGMGGREGGRSLRAATGQDTTVRNRTLTRN